MSEEVHETAHTHCAMAWMFQQELTESLHKNCGANITDVRILRCSPTRTSLEISRHQCQCENGYVHTCRHRFTKSYYETRSQMLTSLQ